MPEPPLWWFKGKSSNAIMVEVGHFRAWTTITTIRRKVDCDDRLDILRVDVRHQFWTTPTKEYDNLRRSRRRIVYDGLLEWWFFLKFSINGDFKYLFHVRGLQPSLYFTPRGDQSNTDGTAYYGYIRPTYSSSAGKSIFPINSHYLI